MLTRPRGCAVIGEECVHKRERGAIRASSGKRGGHGTARGRDEERYVDRFLQREDRRENMAWARGSC